MKRFVNSVSKLIRSFVVLLALGVLCTGVACDKDGNDKPNKSSKSSGKTNNSESGSELSSGKVK